MDTGVAIRAVLRGDADASVLREYGISITFDPSGSFTPEPKGIPVV